MKVIERIFERRLRNVAKVDEMPMGFVPGRGAKDAIFTIRELKEKYVMAERNLHIYVSKKSLFALKER